ncbi:MAG TPA: hypothetical protein DEA08_25370, partial [Planctomycetes bacterium]|nr:hypothetical protein [Planctomycetota bacterium]
SGPAIAEGELRAPVPGPSAEDLATPSTAAGWGEAPYVAPPAAAPVIGGPSFRPPEGVIANPIQPGQPPSFTLPPGAQVVLPAPTEILHVPPPPGPRPQPTITPPKDTQTKGTQPRSEGLDHSQVSARSQAHQRPAPAPAGGADPRRFGIERAFGGYEPSLKELAANQERMLDRLDRIGQSVIALAERMDEVAELRARA